MYREFLEDEAVQDAINAAKGDASSPRYVEGVITAIMAENQPVTYDEIADELGINSTGHVASAVHALYERDIVTKYKDGRVNKVELIINELDETRATAQRRATSQELISSI